MRAADLLPRFLLPPLSTLVGLSGGDEQIRAITGLTRQQWRDLGRAFPALGEDPGPAAARARRRFQFLVGRALRTERHAPEFPSNLPSSEPTVYVTAHLGDLRSLRYLLRRRVPVATVVRSFGRDRDEIAREDLAFDERVRQDFPHALPAQSPHRLRTALRRGSLIVAADQPEGDASAFRCLGGWLPLDRRPFRLARLARVPCRPLFLSAFRGRLAISIGQALEGDPAVALEAFARSLERAAGDCPLLIDGPTWWTLREAR